MPWVLEPGDPVRVPLHHTRPIQHGLGWNGIQKVAPDTSIRKKLTLTTTANTMGPKTKLTFMSMLAEDRSVGGSREVKENEGQ